LAIGRKAAGVNLPLVGGDPGEFFRGDIKHGYVVITVVGVASDEQGEAVGREGVGGKGLVAWVRREIDGALGGEVVEEDVGILAAGVILSVSEEAAIR